MGRIRSIACGVALIGASCVASPARADSIDGHWCGRDGRRLEIAGPTVVTPAGVRASGTYDRHYFSYVAPAADREAGQTVDMALMGEMAVQIRFGAAAPEIWNRCGPPISLPRWPINEKGTGNG